MPVNNTPGCLVEVLLKVFLLLTLDALCGGWVYSLAHELRYVLSISSVLVGHDELITKRAEEHVGVRPAVIQINIGGALVLFGKYSAAGGFGFWRVEYWIVLG